MSTRFEKILQYPDPRLKEKSKDVKAIDSDILSLIKDLKRLAKENSKDGITLVGLSAPQVGFNVRAFVYYDFQIDQYIEAVNPVVIYQSKDMTAEWEGCASVGSGQTSLFAPVKRAKTCQIRFTDVHGKEKMISVTNYQSHVLLHEVDHLDGILFLDRVEDPGMILTAVELDEYARKHGGKYPKLK
jgi:peptide deformylase